MGSDPISETERQTVLQYREEAIRVYEVSSGSHHCHDMCCRQDVTLLALMRKPTGSYENVPRGVLEDKPTWSVNYIVGLKEL